MFLPVLVLSFRESRTAGISRPSEVLWMHPTENILRQQEEEAAEPDYGICSSRCPPPWHLHKVYVVHHQYLPCEGNIWHTWGEWCCDILPCLGWFITISMLFSPLSRDPIERRGWLKCCNTLMKQSFSSHISHISLLFSPLSWDLIAFRGWLKGCNTLMKQSLRMFLVLFQYVWLKHKVLILKKYQQQITSAFSPRPHCPPYWPLQLAAISHLGKSELKPFFRLWTFL